VVIEMLEVVLQVRVDFVAVVVIAVVLVEVQSRAPLLLLR
jgi:hypothetical protein